MFLKTGHTDDEIRGIYDRLCERVAGADDTLRVFVPGTFDRRRVMAQVDRLLADFPETAARPPLFGIPVGVKDIFHCQDYVTRCGSALSPELFQGPEASVVTRLKAAGAVVMGKAATTEFAYFAPAATRNPVNPAHTPGGSSSGSAAGVAAGFFDYALGTQTVGSVIRPAAYCGITGFKPSLGRVDTDGVVPFSQTADQVGVFCRTAADLPAILKVAAKRWRAVQAPVSARLGLPAGAYLLQADGPALKAFGEQAHLLRQAGYDIVEVDALGDIQDINQRHQRLVAAEIARVHASWFQENADRYRSATREIITAGMEVAEKELAPLRRSGTRLRSALFETMARHRLDAWICPSAMGEAPAGLATTGSPLMNLPWTHAGLPAVTVPAGKGPGGLPLGIQLVGPFMADEFLAALSNRIERLFEVL